MVPIASPTRPPVDVAESRLVAPLYDPLLWLGERLGLAALRRELLAGARGAVLEIGAGTGLNLPHYPAGLDQLVLAEPGARMGARIDLGRAPGGGAGVRIVRAVAEELPFPDASFDTVVSTLVLCTVADPQRALSEVARVLRPGGQLLFLEHVRADAGWRRRLQGRSVRAWAAFADGCRCDRPTLETIEDALRIESVSRATWKGMPAIVKPLVWGRASGDRAQYPQVDGAVPTANATLEIEAMGSHFVVTTVPGDGLAGALAAVPHVLRDPIREPHRWSAPAVPVVARAVRQLVAMHPWIEVGPDAEGLLAAVEQLPEDATAVAHFCEHKPGVPGVVIAMEPDRELRAVFAQLPERRHDPVLDRWWIPAREGPLEALGDELDRLATLTATPEVRKRVGRYEQPSLTAAAVVDVAHRCDVAIAENAAGEVGLRLCRRCHPDLEPDLTALGVVTRTFDSWWVSIHGDGRLRALLEARPELQGDRGADLLPALDAAAVQAGTADALEQLSRAEEGRVEVDGLTAPLRPFQGAAVDYALIARRTFLSDEPGLGKTIQALATLEAAGAYPALIVAPASLRINWLREAERWLPHRTRGGLSGGDAIGAHDLSVASYEITHTLVDGALAAPPSALVLDESHFCKTPTARRTQAVTAIADALAEDAIVLLLSGTPVLNRPEELAPQLKILGRLDEIGGARRFARVYARGQELDTLNRRLRRTCFVRRRKADVLRHLPAKQRVIVPVAIANAAEYRAAQSDVAAWVRAQAEADAAFGREIAGLDEDARAAAIRERGRDAEQRARRAQALVRITQLALMAARGKLDGAREWIANFTETGEKLVVFCRHREIGDALLEAFPGAACATGRLDADGRAAEVERFQTDESCRLIVCSLDAAGVGLTMTAASNVAFVELGWTPAAHDQAEDRVHRIGQEEAVTAWYLLAADTIDERIAAVIDRKRELIRAATDGTVAGQDAVLDELLDWLSEDGGGAAR